MSWLSKQPRSNKMNITVIYTGEDDHSYFSEETIDTPIEHPLGKYSIPFTSDGVQFREFLENLVFPMHTAPRPQYILYLKGTVKVITSKGDTRLFQAGDILLAKDTSGKGHETLTIEPGVAAIIPIAQ